MFSVALRNFYRERTTPALIALGLFSLTCILAVAALISQFVAIDLIIFPMLAAIVVGICVYYPPATVVLVFMDLIMQTDTSFGVYAKLGSIPHMYLMKHAVLAIMLFNAFFITRPKTGAFDRRIILAYALFLFFAIQSEWWSASYVTLEGVLTRFITFGYFLLIEIGRASCRERV